MGPRFRWIRSTDAAELAPLSAGVSIVRVDRVLDDDAWQKVATILEPRPDVRLSIEAGDDLEMLRMVPWLRYLGATSLRLRSLDGLRHVAATLETLTVGDTLRRLSLRPVEQVTRLRELDVIGSWNDRDSIGRLTGLERLAIGSVDLEWLRPIDSLRHFRSGGGAIANLEQFPAFHDLELVELWRLRGPHDLDVLASLPRLRYLILESTRAITRIPSFGASPDLRWIALDEMRGIADLQPIADAPNLEVLLLIGMSQLRPEDLRPLIGHRTLRAGIWGLGSLRRNEAARALLPLPPVPGEPMPWNQPDWTGIPHPTTI